ncbi:MAG: MFS transporter [Halieaceae bacterium]|jgi:predicted MFS family arabinose efflux permease|nr:MFS transporter [Halieaceae bacterium]
MTARDGPQHNQLLVVGLVTAAGVDFFHRQIIAIALGPLGQDLQLSDTQRGLLVMVYAIAFAVGSLVLPHFCGRYNRRSVICGAVALSGVLALLSGTTESYAAILMCRAGIGMAIAVVAPLSQLVIAENIALENNSKIQGVVAAGAPMGVIVGMGLWGWVTQQFGWQAGLLFSGVATLLVAGLMFILIGGRPRPLALEHGHPPTFISSLGQLWKIRTYCHMVLGFSLLGAAAMGAVQWLPVFFIRFHGLDLKTVGMVLAGIVGVVGTLSALLSGILGSRITSRDSRGPMWICAGGALTAAPLFIAAYLVQSTAAAVVLMSLATLLGFMGPPQLFVVVQTVVALPLRAFASGLAMASFTALGLGGGVTLVGFISEQAVWGDESLRYALAIVSLLYLWGAVHFLLAAHYSKAELPVIDGSQQPSNSSR